MSLLILIIKNILIACYAALHSHLSIYLSFGPSICQVKLIWCFWAVFALLRLPNRMVSHFSLPLIWSANPHARSSCVWRCWYWRKTSFLRLSHSFKWIFRCLKRWEKYGEIEILYRLKYLENQDFLNRALCFSAGLLEIVRREPGMLCQKNF